MYKFSDYLGDAGLTQVPFADKIQMRFKPAAHQVSGLHLMAQFDRCGIYDEPGTGKTLQLQGYALWLAGQGNKVACVMPPVLVPQFRDTLGLNYREVGDYVRYGTLDGTPAKREALIESWAGDWPAILVMSYKTFVKYYKTLLDHGFTAVLVDEATAVKNPSSQIYNAVKAFAGNHRRGGNGVVLATGTPVETNVIDAYGLISILTPDRYGSKKMFERVHCIKQSVPIKRNEDGEVTATREQIVGYQNFPLLNESLFLAGRRVKKSDVSDLPPRLITEIPITLSRSHRELYQKIVNERIAEIGQRVIDLTEATAIYQALQRLLVCPEAFTDQDIDNELLNALDVLFESLQGQKTVVYAWYQDSIEKLRQRYAHLNPAVLNGQTSAKGRETEKAKFISDPTCRVIFSNPKSGGVGVDGFQDVSSHVVFAEVCPFVGTFFQAIDRLHRNGQKAESVNVYVLVPTGTIAVKLRNDLLRKDTQQELTVQDKRTVLSNLLGDEGLKGTIDAISYSDFAQVDESQEAA